MTDTLPIVIHPEPRPEPTLPVFLGHADPVPASASECTPAAIRAFLGAHLRMAVIICDTLRARGLDPHTVLERWSASDREHVAAVIADETRRFAPTFAGGLVHDSAQWPAQTITALRRLDAAFRVST